MNSKHLSLILFLATVSIYIAVRLWRLDADCLWFDEIFSVHAAEHDFVGLIKFAALDLVHPPLFYLMLKLWITVGGESVFWLRLLPAIFACLAIVPFVLLTHEIQSYGSDRKSWNLSVATLGLFILAVNGPMIKYAQELRGYSLLLLISLTSLWVFVRYVRNEKGILALIVVNILLVYTHYFGWMVLAAEAMVIVFFARERWKQFTIGGAIALAAFVPWLVAVIDAASKSPGLNQNIGLTLRPGSGELFRLCLALIEPFYYPRTTTDAASTYVVTVPLLLLSIGMFVTYATKKDTERPQYRKLLYIFALVPVALAFIASWIFSHSIWGVRHLSMVFPVVAILIADTVLRLGSRQARTVFLTLGILFTSYAFVRPWERPAEPMIWCCWEKLETRTSSEAGSEQHIYAFEDLVAYHLWFATRGSEKTHISVISRIDGLKEDRGFFVPRGFDEISRVNISDLNEKEIWVAFRSSDAKFLTEEPLRSLTVRGYAIAETRTLQSQGTNAYLIKLIKAQ